MTGLSDRGSRDGDSECDDACEEDAEDGILLGRCESFVACFARPRARGFAIRYLILSVTPTGLADGLGRNMPSIADDGSPQEL